MLKNKNRKEVSWMFKWFKQEKKTFSNYQMSEALKDLSTNIRILGKDKKVILVTSTQLQEGKSTLAIGLAHALKNTGERVLLLDGDLRKSKLKERLALESNCGLAEILTGTVKPEAGILTDPVTGLDLMLAGGPTLYSTTLLDSDILPQLLAALKGRYDRIIIDAPTFMAVADAKILAKNSDGVILALEEGRSSFEEVETVISNLSLMHTDLIGAVLTKASLPENVNLQATYYELQ